MAVFLRSLVQGMSPLVIISPGCEEGSIISSLSSPQVVGGDPFGRGLRWIPDYEYRNPCKAGYLYRMVLLYRQMLTLQTQNTCHDTILFL